MSQPPQWAPNPEGINQLLSLLRESQSPSSEVQKQIQQQLNSFRSFPDFNNYLVYIFCKATNEQAYVRYAAGLVLKNNVKEYFSKMPAEVQTYIKNEVLMSLGDPILEVRKTVASLITNIVFDGDLSTWPDLVPSLLRCLESPDYNLVEGAFGALAFLCEDHAYKANNSSTTRPLDDVIPKIIPFFASPHVNLRKQALNCMNQFISEMPKTLLANMNLFLEGVFHLAGTDKDAEVKRRVCQTFVKLTEVRIDYIVPQIRNVVEFMLVASSDLNDDIAIEALEFWSAIAETKLCRQILPEFMPRLLPLLISRMIYSDDDPHLQSIEEDEAVMDQSKDIAPFHASNRYKGAQTSGQTASTEQDDEEDEDDYDDDDDDEEFSEWNTRKCAAAGLDILALVFRDDILPHLLGAVQERLNNTGDWKARESAILCLGAIAEGCMKGMSAHLPNIVPYLLTFLNDPHPLIRKITCWTLSRYSKWIVRQPRETYLQSLVYELLNRMLDKNKQVQEAACSSFATLEEAAENLLVPYLNTILKCLVVAFAKYQAKNLLLLYDAIGTLADSVGHELNQPELINILMPPLIQRWNSLADDDKNLLPLLECLTSVSAALGVGFQNFAQPVFGRCLKLIEKTILQEALYAQNQAEYPEKEFQVCALDLISGMVEGLQSSIESLVANSNLVQLLYQCCKDSRPDVRQSAFAMVGDLSKSCIIHLKPLLHEYLPVLINNIEQYTFVAVCNNACWAIGEIAIRIGADFNNFAPTALSKLITLINKLLTRSNQYSGLLENAAISVGRIGIVCDQLIAPRLEEFIQPWCKVLRDLRDDAEKDSAFRGLCKLIKANPNGVVKHFPYVCDAIGSWEQPQPDLKETFSQILFGFKNSMGANWPNYFAAFPEQLRTVLQDQYRLQ